jgi:hypothetical protein
MPPANIDVPSRRMVRTASSPVLVTGTVLGEAPGCVYPSMVVELAVRLSERVSAMVHTGTEAAPIEVG